MKQFSGDITVLGAGLVGTLMATYMAKKGFKVGLYEQRGDIRRVKLQEGRSINLAVSHRGWTALENLGIADTVRPHVVPMKGRMIHDQQGNLNYQPYGKEGQAIYSVSRGLLNQVLVNIAEESGVKLHFGHKCTYVDLKHGITYFTVTAEEVVNEVQTDADLVVGSDGAFSAVRKAMQRTDRFNFCQEYLSHGYKELSIPAGKDGSWLMEPNALHIWPRGDFMLIALPNHNGTFTCTLFLPFEGENSFASLNSPDAIVGFFERNFPDALERMPNLLAEYEHNPTSSLVTVSCWPWTRYNKAMLVGDAAHAMVPFYGQGMNAGFEDVHVFADLIDQHQANWKEVLPHYEQIRKPDADAISELALTNFIEMREKVADPDFLLRKKIDAHLHELYPHKWIPEYTMVTFSNRRYSEALKRGSIQTELLTKLSQENGIEKDWESRNYDQLIEQQQKRFQEADLI